MNQTLQYLSAGKIVIRSLLIILIFFTSCKEKKIDDYYKYTVNEQDCSYSIKVPKLIQKNKDNYIEILDYKSDLDSAENRYGTVYIFLEDADVTESVFQFDKLDKLKYSEQDLLQQTKFIISNDLLEGKEGVKKLTVIIFDLKLNNNFDLKSEEDVNMTYIDSRRHFEVAIE